MSACGLVMNEEEMGKRQLTNEMLRREAKRFALLESEHNEPQLYGVTDGKAVGTYLEHKFQTYLHEKYKYVEGSSAKGIDFPGIKVDLKVTSIRKPQSSCPFKSARQKICGLGYSLLFFVYDKSDDDRTRTANLRIAHAVYVDEGRTADYLTTYGLRKIIESGGNIDDVIAFFEERMLPVSDIECEELAQEVLEHPPEIGYLTISIAWQWRLYYSHVIKEAGNIDGIVKVV